MKDTLIAVYGSKKFFGSSRNELVDILRELLIPKLTGINKTIEVGNCRQRFNEKVEDYFCRKSKIINASFPHLDDESKITMIHEGLLSSIKQKIPTYTRYEDDITLCRFLHILTEIEEHLKKPDTKSWNKDKFNTYQQKKPFIKKNDEEDKLDEDKKEIHQAKSSLKKDTKFNKIVCGKCGKNNHSTEKCFKKDKPNFKPDTNSRTASRLKIEKSLICKFRINNQLIEAVIDSGAEMSILKTSIAEKCG